MESGFLDASPIWTDLKTFPWRAFCDRVDILSGGYPCQPFSSAGKRLGTDDSRHLWPYIADGIRILRPKLCFFENVEGHITLGLREVIGELESMGYAVSWGIFSAREVGAPHQRKRVFILAHRDGERGQLSDWWKLAAESLSVSDGETRRAWPSRPGQPQHGFEPPRVVIGRMANANGTQPSEGRGNHAEVPQVSAGEWADDSAIVSGGESEHRGEGMGNANNIDRGTSTGGRINDAEAGSAGESVGNTAEQGCQRSRRTNDSRGEIGRPTESNGGCAYRTMEQSERQTKPSLGECFDESSSLLDKTLTLNPYGHNVHEHENLSKKRIAREILFEVWTSASSEAIQWTTGGLQYFLAEKILQSEMQLDRFTQRICYFVWCLQTGHQAQGWGLSGMSVCESCRNSSQGQKPIEQFKRELGYAMCQLSYEIALERRQDSEETTGILHGVRESSERAWVLSEALPEMEEVWRSTLDQEVWEKGCYVEATSIGNRTDELRLLGNGVVPATATLAFQTLLTELLAL